VGKTYDSIWRKRVTMTRTTIALELATEKSGVSSFFVLRNTLGPTPSYDQIKAGIEKGCTPELFGYEMNTKASGCKKPKFEVEIAENLLHLTIKYTRECKNDLGHEESHFAMVTLHKVVFETMRKPHTKK